MAHHEDITSRRFDIFMLALITLNVAVVMLETVRFIEEQYFFYLHIFDVFSVIIFSIEYALRLWTCTVDERYRRPVVGRVRFVLSPLAIIDFLAILPFYLQMVIHLLIPVDLRFIRILRLFRIVRVLKMGHYSESVKTFERVFARKKEELFMAIFVVMILLILSASVIYYAEHMVQPDKFGSIPEAMWWGIITLATVGYGDVVPITPLGKFIGGIVALLGVAVYALPTAILAAGFAEELAIKNHHHDHHTAQERGSTTLCPYCGQVLPERREHAPPPHSPVQK